MTTSLDLTDEEIVALDGRCTPATQVAVDAAKTRMAMVESLAGVPAHIARFLADVRAEAEKTGQLGYRHVDLRSCGLCGAHAGYATFKRDGRYHRKGQPNIDKPRYLYGVDLVARRFVVMKGYASLGGCNACIAIAKPLAAQVLADVKAEIPEALTGHPPRWKRYDRRRCLACGWVGHEGEMGRRPTLMHDGTFPAVCPACKVEQMPLGANRFEWREGFDVVPVEPTP